MPVVSHGAARNRAPKKGPPRSLNPLFRWAILSVRRRSCGYTVLNKRHCLPARKSRLVASTFPLLASERRARRELIQQWTITHDPFVAAALCKQEDREIPFLEELTATVGKKHANWRTVLQWEARHDQQARAELAHWLAEAAMADDPQDSKCFHAAEAALRRALADGPFERAKALAILWVLRYVCEKHCWPTRSMVKVALKEMNCRFPSSKRGQNDARFFSGSVLGRVLKDKGGRPHR